MKWIVALGAALMIACVGCDEMDDSWPSSMCRHFASHAREIAKERDAGIPRATSRKEMEKAVPGNRGSHNDAELFVLASLRVLVSRIYARTLTPEEVEKQVYDSCIVEGGVEHALQRKRRARHAAATPAQAAVTAAP